MTAVSPVAYLTAHLDASQQASERLVQHLTSAGTPLDQAREMVARHVAESAVRLRTENESILGANKAKSSHP